MLIKSQLHSRYANHPKKIKIKNFVQVQAAFISPRGGGCGNRTHHRFPDSPVCKLLMLGYEVESKVLLSFHDSEKLA